jgi:hypothetical protein
MWKSMYKLCYRSFLITVCQLEISGCRRSVSSRLSVSSAQILKTMGTCRLYTRKVGETCLFSVLSLHLKTSGSLINVKFFISPEEWRSRCTVSLFSTTADTFKATTWTCTTLENYSLSLEVQLLFRKIFLLNFLACAPIFTCYKSRDFWGFKMNRFSMTVVSSKWFRLYIPHNWLN